MALTLLTEMPDAARYDIKILATDIDPNVLATAEAGIYEPSLLEPVPDGMRRNWFTPLNDGSGRMRANDELRNLISFNKLNLIGSWQSGRASFRSWMTMRCCISAIRSVSPARLRHI
jgi:chemotaxis protein methyltransferase CheR